MSTAIPQQDWSAKWAIYSPHKIAFEEYETARTLTFLELNRLANRLAHHWQKQYQLQKGDRIAVLAENCLEYIILFALAQKTGAILVPLNYRLASAEIDYLLKDAAPKVLVTEQQFLAKARASATYHCIPHHSSIEALARYCNKKEQKAEDHYFETVSVTEDDPIFILYTSGTTGFPKGALYTHKMLFWNSVNTAISLIVNTESRTLNCMPPFHTGGWNVLTTPFLHHGAYTCLLKSFDANAVLKLIEQKQLTIFMGVPTMLKMMEQQAAFEQTNYSSLHYFIVGGEPMPIPLIERWQAKGVPIRQGFGMTEAGPNLTSLHQSDAIRKKGSIGRSNFYVQTRIVKADESLAAPNEEGELRLKGPMITIGYWQNPLATEKAYKDGWFCTGDIVKQDEEGYLYVMDRIKNMYISGGENVYPAQVERVLLEHPQVQAAAVIGVPDAKWGETGCAFIVAAAPLTANELIAYCKANLAGFKVPKSIVFLDELPKNDTGKIDRLCLKRMHVAKG